MRPPSRPALAWALTGALWLASCAVPGAGNGRADTAGTPIEPGVPAPAQVSAAPLGVGVAVQPWVDARPGAPGRRVGTAKAPVFGVHDNRLVLPREATAVMGEALAARMHSLGLTVLPPAAPADFTVAASLQALELAVEGRDRRHVAVQAEVRRGTGGPVLWEGRIEDRNDRFAGVSGNTRSDLEAFLGDGIGNVADQLAGRVARLAAETAARQPASAGAGAVATTGAAGATVAAAPRPGAAETAAREGQVAIVTTPARVKVYVDDVYHGLTPITLELPAGVHVLHFRRDGCRTVTEKVAVRRAATVELEIKLPDC